VIAIGARGERRAMANRSFSKKLQSGLEITINVVDLFDGMVWYEQGFSGKAIKNLF